jgi:hypothetical protein
VPLFRIVSVGAASDEGVKSGVPIFHPLWTYPLWMVEPSKVVRPCGDEADIRPGATSGPGHIGRMVRQFVPTKI